MATEGAAIQQPLHHRLRHRRIERRRSFLGGLLVTTLLLSWVSTIGHAQESDSAVGTVAVKAIPASNTASDSDFRAEISRDNSFPLAGPQDVSGSRDASAQREVGSQDSASPQQVSPPLATSSNELSSDLISDALNQRGSITFRKTSLQEVVFLLSDLWKVNIVAGEKITGTVSGVFNDAPLRDVLSAILTSSGYGYTSVGNSLIVLPMEEVGTGSPDFRSRTIPLNISDETQMASTIEAAKMLLSDRGKIQAFGSGSVLVIDTPERIDIVEQMFVSSGVGGRRQGNGVSGFAGNQWAPPRIAYFTPQYTEASEMAVSLAKALGSEEGGGGDGGNSGAAASGPVVAVYEEENRIMVKGTPDELALASEAFQQLDVPRAQVRITTMIYDVGLKELEELGVDWSRNFRLNTVDGTPLSEFAGNASEAIGFSTGGAAGAASIGLRTLSSNFDAGALLKALDTTAEAKLLADPSITTADRREASIKIVQRIPIIAASPTQQSGVVYAQVEFEDAGIILKVTPRISHDQTIEMKVQPEYSVVTDYIGNNPVIDSRTAETTVRVKNGHMFVLGGLRQKTVTETVGGVPWLRDMKYVGGLFRNHTTEIRESELIVFLKPELISPCYQGKPREQIAARVTSNQLDNIAYATCCPLTPMCCDPKCPNHHPRCRVNGGSQELRMIGENGITPFQLAYPEESVEVILHDQFNDDQYTDDQYNDPTIVGDLYETIPLPATTVQ